MKALALPAARKPLWRDEFAAASVRLMLSPLQLLITAPSALFLAALATMLLWNPDVPIFPVNRIVFGLLVLGVVGRSIILRQRLLVIERISWPMIALTILVLASVVSRPFDKEAWGLMAAKYVVPFTMFHLSAVVFTDARRLRHFEVFALVVLGYLSFTAVAFLIGAHSLVFPKFILDPNLGHHVDRARGPFLQAVANGVSINILGLLALHGYLRGTFRGWKAAALLASVPIAILATMTRAVWFSFTGALAALIIVSHHRAVRRAGYALILIGILAVATVLTSSQLNRVVKERFTESQPVEFRQAVYKGSWQMFLDRPLTGWGFHQMPLELPRYVSGYQEKVLYPHNTYLEVLVENGSAGLALYLWLMWEMWQLRRGSIPAGESEGFLGRGFHRIWPILLGVYWVNAAVVVMSYQFVNALLFSMAGMLAAQRRRALESCPC